MATELFTQRRSAPAAINHRNLILEIDRLRTLVDRLRNRKDGVDKATLRTYEDMLETRLRLLEQNV